MKPPMLDDQRGARVLVTGGAGFVGSALVRQLLRAGAYVIVLDNYLSGRPENLEEVNHEITFLEGDVLDRDNLAEVFRTHEPSYVYHLVGDTFVLSAYRHPLRFLRVNAEGTLNMLLTALEFGVERMLYVSSAEVYGQTGREPIAEAQNLAPVNTYAVTKLAADRLCYTFHLEHDLPVIIARIFNCYGPRETQPYVVPEIIRQLRDNPVVQLGNVDAARDLTYVDDTAHGLMAFMSSSLPNGEAVNLGSGRLVGLATIVETCARLLGREDYRIEHDPRRERRLDIDAFCCDATRLRDTTGWSPQVALEDGLRLTVEWFRSHGSRWLWEEWCSDGIIRPPSSKPGASISSTSR